MKSITGNRYLTREEVSYLVSLYEYEKPVELSDLIKKLIKACESVIDYIIPEELLRVQSKYPNIVVKTNKIQVEIRENDSYLGVQIEKLIPHIKRRDGGRPKPHYRDSYGIVINDFFDRIPEMYRDLIIDYALDIKTIELEHVKRRYKFKSTIEQLRTQEIRLYYPWCYDKLMERFNKEKEKIIPRLKALDEKIKETIN